MKMFAIINIQEFRSKFLIEVEYLSAWIFEKGE